MGGKEVIGRTRNPTSIIFPSYAYQFLRGRERVEGSYANIRGGFNELAAEMFPSLEQSAAIQRFQQAVCRADKTGKLSPVLLALNKTFGHEALIFFAELQVFGKWSDLHDLLFRAFVAANRLPETRKIDFRRRICELHRKLGVIEGLRLKVDIPHQSNASS